MKNIVYLFIACFTIATASAQSQIDKDMQGVWKLYEMTVNGTTIGVAANTITFSKEQEAALTPQQREGINAKKGEVIDKLKGSKITVAGIAIELLIADMNKKGTYSTKPYSDAHILTITYEDGTTDDMAVFIKDKKLHITKSDDANRDEMVFAK